jgi:TIR domain
MTPVMNDTMLIVVLTVVVVGILFLVGRAGGQGGLHTSELTAVLGLAAVIPPLGTQVLSESIFGGSPAERLWAASVFTVLFGLTWIRLRKGFFISPAAADGSVATASPADAPRSQPAAASRSPVSAAAPAIFLSYRRGETSDVTGRIYDRLVQHFGADSIFKDVDSIPLGVDFRQHLAESVAQCGLLVAVVGRQWTGRQEADKSGGVSDPRDFVRVEVEAAMQRRIPVIPVLVQGASLPREEELPESLQPFAYYNAVAVRSDPDFHSDVARLIKGIERHLTQPRAS